MKYQYQMGGIFEDIIEGVIKGGAGVYDKEKTRQKEAADALKAKGEAADKKAAEKKDGLLDKITKPVQDAAKAQAKADITKWAIIIIGIYLLTKGR